ncbi:MAG: rhomboid family intramembrane serine protease [Haloferacaceae archaeon]
MTGPSALSAALAVPVSGLGALQRLALVLVALGAVQFLRRRGDGDVLGTLRRRLVFGVPWGTLLTVAGVLAVYLFLQGGLAHWASPTTIPFRAWSYFYPLGVVTAPFAHVGPDHLLGNLVGTLAMAPLVEYAWGHYPRRRGAHSFGSLRANPYARILAVPAGAGLVGLLTGAFSVGPVIGFSGVVFAFAGGALAVYPVRTLVALLAGRVLRLAVASLQTPVVTATAQPSFSTPWWAQVAIQGHALGLLVGVLAGLWYVRSRPESRPSARRVFAGVLLYGVAQSLWAVYWFRGNDTFVLYRATGLALVVVLAVLVAGTVAASARPLVGDGPAGRSLRSIPRWQALATVLLLVLGGLAGPGVAVNLAAATDEPLPGETVQVRDYEVTYAENVENGMVSVVDVRAFGETTSVNTSGVIVRSRERNVWLTAVSKGRLAFDGQVTVRVGGVGWRDHVVVNRTGWTAVGGNATYRVRFRHDDRARTVYTAPPSNASPVVAGRNVSVRAVEEGFRIAVTRGDLTVDGPLPPRNESITLDGVRFVRDGRRLVAVRGDTRVPVAKRETYE